MMDEDEPVERGETADEVEVGDGVDDGLEEDNLDDDFEDAADDCTVCRQLHDEGYDATDYKVIPAKGGGWQKWSEALLRYVIKMGTEPTQAVIISQPHLSQRYVQFQIGHGIAHAEVGSNVYMMGDARLTAADEQALVELGWQPPESDEDDEDEMPANWTLRLIRGDWSYLTQMLLAAMVGVLGFREDALVEMKTFTCDHPCRDCSWPSDDELSEIAASV